MDPGQILLNVLMAAMALGGLAIGVIAIVSLKRLVGQQQKEIVRMAMSKPFHLIEKDDEGIRQISTLRGRVEQLEKTQRDEIEAPIPDVIERAILEQQYGQEAYVGSMADADEPEALGERAPDMRDGE